MPSRYHPLEEGLWDDPKFDAGAAGLPEAPFEERGFFAYLFSNPRQRPSGIYRATDGQLAEGSRLPLRRVTAYLVDLHKRSLIVRDGAWIFLPGYLKRQANSQRLLLGAARDVDSCESVMVLEAFVQRYPLYSKWSTDRLETLKRRSVDGCKVMFPQSTSEQSTSEQSTSFREPDGLQTVSRRSQAKDLLDTWSDIYREKFGQRPEVEGKRDMECAKAILSGRDLGQAREVVRYHFEHPGEFYREKGLYGIHHIRKDCNQIIARMRADGRFQFSDLPKSTQRNLKAGAAFVAAKGDKPW